MDIDAVFADPPLFEHRMLDVHGRMGRPDAPVSDWLGRCVVRIFTGDPFEGARGGRDRFIANHLLDEPEIMLYLSWGEAREAAAKSSWDEALRAALATALNAGARHAEVMASGRYTGMRLAGEIPDLASLDVGPVGGDVSLHTVGWTGWTMGTIIDLVEEREGPVGYDSAPLAFLPATKTDPACPVCAGVNLYAPHVPAPVFDVICVEHLRQWDELSAAGLPEMRPEAARALSDILSALDMMPVPSGLRTYVHNARMTGIDAELALEDDLRARFPGLDEGAMAAILAGSDDLTDWLLGLLERSWSDDADRGVQIGDKIRRLSPGLCWAVDLDRSQHLEGEMRDAALSHLAGHGRRLPICYVLSAEGRETDGDRVSAIGLYWKGLASGVSVGHLETCHRSLEGLRRLDPGHEALARFEAALAAGRVATLKPGRNEPCLCGSGLKSKRCCG
jgi:hypothetical protein